jgi:hypothetical protein
MVARIEREPGRPDVDQPAALGEDDLLVPLAGGDDHRLDAQAGGDGQLGMDIGAHASALRSIELADVDDLHGG